MAAEPVAGIRVLVGGGETGVWRDGLAEGSLGAMGNPRLLRVPCLLMILCLESGRGRRFQPLTREREWACSLPLRFNSIIFALCTDSRIITLSNERGHGERSRGAEESFEEGVPGERRPWSPR